MLSKQLYRQEYPTGKKPEKSQIALVLAVNLFTRIGMSALGNLNEK